jgi:hypothetical protein
VVPQVYRQWGLSSWGSFFTTGETLKTTYLIQGSKKVFTPFLVIGQKLFTLHMEQMVLYKFGSQYLFLLNIIVCPLSFCVFLMCLFSIHFSFLMVCSTLYTQEKWFFHIALNITCGYFGVQHATPEYSSLKITRAKYPIWKNRFQKIASPIFFEEYLFNCWRDWMIEDFVVVCLMICLPVDL